MQNAILLAGEQKLDNEISNIMVMEAPDLARWMQPGHLLLSSLFSMQESSATEMETFVRQIKDLKGAGLVIKTERFVKDVPPALIVACKKLEVPLIQIHKEVLYSDIQIEVMQELFNEKVVLLDYHHKLHIRFTQFALKQPSLDEVLQAVAELVGNPVGLLNHKKERLFVTDERLEHTKILGSLPTRGDQMSFSHKKYHVSSEGTGGEAMQVNVKIPSIGGDTHHLIVVDLDRELTKLDYVTLENAASFLQMRFIQVFAVAQVKQNYLNDLFDDLLNDKFTTTEEMREAVEALGLSFEEHYRLVVIRLRIQNGAPETKTQHKRFQQLFVDSFRKDWKDSFYRIRSDRIILLLPVKTVAQTSFKERVKASMQRTQADLPKTPFIYQIGVGDSCEISQLGKVGNQPLRIVQFASALHQDSFVLDADDLGLYRFFANVSDKERLLDLIPSPLRALHRKSPELAETLRVFLDNRQQLKLSAELMYIHPKTMRYRLDRIAELTKIDFENPEEILSYNIGFRILKVMGDDLQD
jgi:purine catabolism regulator